MKAIILAGPSASGKSRLAIQLAQRFNGEIINADSMQVYAPLHILTARPNFKDPEFKNVRHHLDGVLSGFEPGSVAWWYEKASEAIVNIHERGKVPIVVGGTGLYIKALTDGLSDIPSTTPEVRRQVQALWDSMDDPAAFANMVYNIDPLLSEKIMPFDKQRLIRAWEVYQMTGQSIRILQMSPRKLIDLNYLFLLLKPDRSLIYEAVDIRMLKMVEAGAIDEVMNLLRLKLPASSPVLKAVGVPEFTRYLKQEISMEEAILLAQRASRNYVKRQYTWFSHQLQDKQVYEFSVPQNYLKDTYEKALSFLEQQG